MIEIILSIVEKKPKVMACLILVLLIGPLFFVHVLFKCEAINDFWIANWSAGDLILYLAGFYSFIGTLTLGLASIIQTKKSEKINRIMMENNLIRDFRANLFPKVVFIGVDPLGLSPEGMKSTNILYNSQKKEGEVVCKYFIQLNFLTSNDIPPKNAYIKEFFIEGSESYDGFSFGIGRCINFTYSLLNGDLINFDIIRTSNIANDPINMKNLIVMGFDFILMSKDNSYDVPKILMANLKEGQRLKMSFTLVYINAFNIEAVSKFSFTLSPDGEYAQFGRKYKFRVNDGEHDVFNNTTESVKVIDEMENKT